MRRRSRTGTEGPLERSPQRRGRGPARTRLPATVWAIGLTALIVGSVAWVALEGSEEGALGRDPVLVPRERPEDADRLVGRAVVVTGEVGGELPDALVIRGSKTADELLVVPVRDVSVRFRPGEAVWIEGSVERFAGVEFRRFGRFDDPAYGRFEGRPVILATGIHRSAP